MKTALYLVLGLAVLVAVVVAYASTKPDTFRIARSIHVNAPPEKIFPLINDLRKFGLWSPYEKKDPNMKRTFSGPEVGKGAKYEWDGDRNVGSGWLLISDSAAPSKVDFDLNMLTPIEAHNQVEFTIVPEGGATNVTWAMQGKASLIAKVMHLCFNMDRMVGKDFEDGLANLKTVAERS